MSVSVDEVAAPPPAPLPPERPRSIDPGRASVDKVFYSTVRTIGIFVLVLTGSIALFLGYQLKPAIKLYGWKFFTNTAFGPNLPIHQNGILAALTGTIEVALVAVCVGFPLALLTALYISEYAPARLKPTLVSLVDLMAAVPSIIFGIWGSAILQDKTKYISRWLDQHFGWIPIFHVNTDPNAAQWQQSKYTGSLFIAGICVGMMIIPLACSVMRGVFMLAPIGEREAAYALGSTRWGVVRTVVLPFGRGGIIGGTMLGLGRALGETIAVLLILHAEDGVTPRILQSGGNTISYLIANGFGGTTGTQLSALLAAGFVLFVMTIGINTIAAAFVARSRSGADI